MDALAGRPPRSCYLPPPSLPHKGRRMNKNAVRTPALAVLILLFAFSLPAAPSFAGPSADIRRLEDDFNASYAANDLDKYFGYSPAPKPAKS